MAEILDINATPVKDVKLFRLRHTSEEFIAELLSELDDGSNTITYNIRIPLMPVQREGQLGFIPWSMLSSSPEFAIQASDLLFPPRDTVPSLVGAYVYHTTGIETNVSQATTHKIVTAR